MRQARRKEIPVERDQESYREYPFVGIFTKAQAIGRAHLGIALYDLKYLILSLNYLKPRYKTDITFI